MPTRKNTVLTKPPVEITKSLASFRRDYPDSSEVGFLMMRFGKPGSLGLIMQAVRAVAQESGVSILRADQKKYHDDVYWNIMTYIYGSGFGVALFERIETEIFNPNIAFELGYMYAIGKPVCLLKDRTIPVLPVDIMGKIYLEFDVHHPRRSLRKVLTTWLCENGFFSQEINDDPVKAYNAMVALTSVALAISQSLLKERVTPKVKKMAERILADLGRHIQCVKENRQVVKTKVPVVDLPRRLQPAEQAFYTLAKILKMPDWQTYYG